MPNRWLKADILTSDRWNGVSLEAQNLYVRLLLVSDDHGRFDGRESVIESTCFPLKTFACNCAQMLSELEAIDLIRGYVDLKGKPFLLIPRFYERPRSKSRFPEPPEEVMQEQGCTHLFADACKCKHSNTTATATSTTTAITTTNTTKPLPAGSATPPARKRVNGEAPTSAVWQAYSSAYLERYGTEPVRNASVNGQLANFITRIPALEAADVAAYYVRHNAAFYVRGRHPVNLLLRDCEGLRTQWATGIKSTGLEARSAEQVDSVTEQIRRVGRELERTDEAA